MNEEITHAPMSTELSQAMVYVYRLDEKLSNGFCHGGGNPVTFLNVDWFNAFEGATGEGIAKHIRDRSYCEVPGYYLILCPELEMSHVFRVE